MTTAHVAEDVVGPVAPERVSTFWPGYLLPVGTVLITVVAAVLLLLTPPWMHFAIPASGGSVSSSFFGDLPQAALTVSDQTVNELLFGPGTFEIEMPCDWMKSCQLEFVYSPDEAAHLRDARAVLYVFLGLAVLSALFVAAALLRQPRDVRRWRAVSRGGSALVVAMIVLGVFAVVAFDAAFELFHRVFFPGGNWEFPADSNLIRLYPYAFWQLTSGALGVLATVGGGLVWYVARSRARALERTR